MDAVVFTYTTPGKTVATVTLEGPPPGESAVRLLKSFLDLVKESLAEQVTAGVESQSAPTEGPGAD